MTNFRFRLLMCITSLILVSCGGSGGGGGGSSNLPINPGNNSSTRPINPDNSNNDRKPNNPSGSRKPEEKIPTTAELREKLGEEGLRKYVLKVRNESTEGFPTDILNRNGSSVKVAVLDGDFINEKQRLKNIYSEIEILDRNPEPKETDHSKVVLKALRENNKLGVIATSIGENDDGTGQKGSAVIPKIEYYQETLERFSPKQKVKVFSQSWGVPEEIGSYRGKSEEEKLGAIATGNQTIDEGRKILKFYQDQVKKNTLFVWAE